jgi:putative ABC transport system substrate-binding protein
MRRRDFIALVGGAAAAPAMLWPHAARAQQAGGMRRIGVLLGGAENDSAAQAYAAALREGLAKLGWVEGRNLRIELRFDAGDPSRMRAHAAELVSLAPDVLVSNSTPGTRAVQLHTTTTPIIFILVNDPVATGLVGSLARPEGNATGFANFEPSIGGKWIELLKEAAPRVTRVALIYSQEFNPQISSGGGYATSVEAAASAFAVKVTRTPVQNAADIERTIVAFAAEPNGGLLVPADVIARIHRELIYRLAAQHRLPAIYPYGYFAREGGLVAYGVNAVELWQRGASYVDRILRGAKVGELPVQLPTKFELVINLKAAKAIGLTIPESFLLRADELIE